ncbi:hypothetical protein L873DRAFT_1820063 [Choiromyces venosus 120613-1]|uniref:Uncharacterized protein n=1 Tax=Choiromyces venosus 120613-1 TaxID=1336337 RepID=A0A3N4J3B0_9PEZI|nr:hypothetical protein L873DRAFT_1820063 [Choiromyces venosus 120613-1]
MSFGGFSDITRDNDRAHSAGYKSSNRNDRDSENSGRGYDNGLSSGRYRQRQDEEERDSNNRYGVDAEQRESYGREERDRGGGGGYGRRYSDDNNNERRTRLNDDNDSGRYNQNRSSNRDRGGTESWARGYGNQEREETNSYSRGTYGSQDSERSGGLAGDDPGRILKSAVSASIQTFGKAYEKSSSLNQEPGGGSNYQNNNNRVENSAFGNRVENQESEIKKGGQAIGSVLNTVKNALGSGIENLAREE